MKEKSFTLIEILVVLGIVAVILVFVFLSYRFIQQKTDLDYSAEKVLNTLRLAQNKTLASEGASQYGVYFNISTTPHQYTLFKGASYASRDFSFDKIYRLSDSIEIYDINLQGGAAEVVFNRIAGDTAFFGDLSLRLKADPAETKSFYIEQSGHVDLLSPPPSSDADRVKDSRHVHFVYSQDVTSSVTFHLVFSDYPSDNFDIDFQNYLNPGQTEFSWEGSVSVGPGGSKTEQKLIIKTHAIELGSAEFSVHRDLRYNDKALEIILDDQSLIQYSSTGETTKGSSIHVSNPQQQ